MSNTKNKKVMRKTIIFAAILTIALATGCKKEQPQDEAAEKKARQEAFKKQLSEYPSKTEAFLFKAVHGTKAAKVGKASYGKGQQMTIRKGGKQYAGKAPENITALWADGQVIIPGGKVLKPKKNPGTTYAIERGLEGKTWGYYELLPYVKKYALTLRVVLHDGTLGGVIQTLEEYLDIAAEYGNPRFVITDVIPYATVEGGGERYLMGHDNPWRVRPEYEGR